MFNCSVHLLKSINVGKSNRLKTGAFAKDFSLRFEGNLRSIGASGNFVYGGKYTHREVQNKIHEVLMQVYRLDCFIWSCTREQWKHISQAHVFADWPEISGSRLLVAFCEHFLSEIPTAWSQFPEPKEWRNKTLHIAYTEGVSKSKFTQAIIESQTESHCTMRNWNTVQKICSVVQTFGT